ncbi:hypothetical protein IFM61606_03381 [Aspergillus udagawae]|nr:hypothetical protein IFM61606_03381 [Aspergillus udagawae]
MWSLESIWAGNCPHVTLGLIYFNDIVHDYAKITWTAAQYGVEKFGLVLLRDVSNDTVMTDHTNGSDMIAKKAKATAKLAITTSLTMPTHILLELIADANVHQCSIMVNGVAGIQNHQVLVCVAKVDLNVLATGRRCTTVLVTTTLDSDSDFVLSGSVHSLDDVFVSFRLNDEIWVHVVIILVS